MPDIQVEYAQDQYTTFTLDDVSDVSSASNEDATVSNENAFSGTAGVDTGTVLCDTGNIATAGLYEFEFIAATDGFAANFDIEHRNVGNTATLRSARLAFPTLTAWTSMVRVTVRITQPNQRVRATLQSDPGAGVEIWTAIRGRRVGS